MRRFSVTAITTIIRYIPVDADSEEEAKTIVDGMSDEEIEEYDIVSQETTTEDDVEVSAIVEEEPFFPPSICAYCEQPLEPRDACICPSDSKPHGSVVAGLYYCLGILINDQVRTPIENRLGTVIGLTHSGYAQIHIHDDASIAYAEAEQLAAWNGLRNSGDQREPHQLSA